MKITKQILCRKLEYSSNLMFLMLQCILLIILPILTKRVESGETGTFGKHWVS